MKNSTLLMITVLAAVAMLSAAIVLPIQQASANADTIFKFSQKAYSKADDGSTAFNIQSQNFGSGGGSCRLQ
jgi:hypothetical protein